MNILKCLKTLKTIYISECIHLNYETYKNVLWCFIFNNSLQTITSNHFIFLVFSLYFLVLPQFRPCTISSFIFLICFSKYIKIRALYRSVLVCYLVLNSGQDNKATNATTKDIEIALLRDNFNIMWFLYSISFFHTNWKT